MKKFFFYFFILMIIAVTVEAAAYLFTLTGFGRGYIRQYLPTHSVKRALAIRTPYLDDHEIFGRWRHPHSELREKKTCFDLTYKANFVGARDRERAKKSTKDRTIVLGDSFIEGIGVDNEFRVTDLLEKRTGIEHLNFGHRGYGTTQQYILYKHLAKSFSHSRVLLGILPANDFLDIDLEFGKKHKKYRYRPFFKGTYPDYELTYYPETVEIVVDRKRRIKESLIAKFKILVGEFSYASRVYVEVKNRIWPDPKDQARGDYANFNILKRHQLDLMRFSIEKILEETEGKPLSAFLIPATVDLESYDRLGEAPLSKEFKKWGGELGFQVIDLLPLMHAHTDDWEKYSLDCDGHWSHYGNEVVAHYLKKAVYKPQVSVPAR